MDAAVRPRDLGVLTEWLSPPVVCGRAVKGMQ